MTRARPESARAMSLTVIRNADIIVCMDDPRREIVDGAIAFRMA